MEKLEIIKPSISQIINLFKTEIQKIYQEDLN